MFTKDKRSSLLRQQSLTGKKIIFITLTIGQEIYYFSIKMRKVRVHTFHSVKAKKEIPIEQRLLDTNAGKQRP